MDRIVSLLKTAIAVIAFLFGAFNDFLANYAPPPLYHEPGDAGTEELTVGLAKFISLALLLFISLVFNYQSLHTKKKKKDIIVYWLWIIGGGIVAFAVVSFDYQRQFEEKTFTPFGEDRYMRGILSVEALQICQTDYVGMDVRACEVELMNDVSAEGMDAYWVPGSRDEFRKELQVRYMALVILLSVILFSLVEVLGWNIFHERKLP
jgi:amino acid transporter